MKTFNQFLLKEKTNKGIQYERKVKKSMRNATKGRPTQVTRAKGGGAFSAHDQDMVLRIDGKEHAIEIKENARSQMGGISITYDYKSKDIIMPNLDMEDESRELIIATIQEKVKDLDKVIEWFKENDEVFQFNKTPGFPLRVSQEAWKEAVDDGVIRELNETIKNNAKFINSYYKKKNVNYMQIGGSGLFYLSSNPLKLDIPQLQGQINLEFRAGKSGKKYNKTNDYEYSTVILRLQGRLSFKGKSSINIDTEIGAGEFLDLVENTN